MVIEATAFPRDESTTHASADPFSTNGEIHKCYSCLLTEKGKEHYIFKQPAFLTRYPNWKAFINSSIEHAPNQHLTRPEWAHKTLWKYTKEGKLCSDVCVKHQGMIAPIEFVGIRNFRNRSPLSSFL